jgi:putative SOS response-associated peptidase YedK
MCGRVKLPEDVSVITEGLHITRNNISDYLPRYNTAPTDPIPVVTSVKGERTLELMRWGLIPWWALDMKVGFSSFNARAETVATKPGFRDAWKRGQRCLVVVDGFYEWRKPDKQPFYISLGNRQPMTFAGLWDRWKPKDGSEPVRSCTIITTEANALVAPIHDRMPVIVGAEEWAKWLGEEPLDDPATLLKPFPAERMTMWPVSKAVGNVKNQGRELAEHVSAGS